MIAASLAQSYVRTRPQRSMAVAQEGLEQETLVEQDPLEQDWQEWEDPDALPPEVPMDLHDDRWMSEVKESHPLPNSDDDELRIESAYIDGAVGARELDSEALSQWSRATGLSLESYLRDVFAGTSSFLNDISLALKYDNSSLSSVELRADIGQAPANRDIGEWEQVFTLCPFGTRVEHQRLHLDEEAIGQGVGQKLWSSAISTYRKMGISEVQAWADGGSSGYGLAHYGFKPPHANRTRELFASLREKLPELRLSQDVTTRVHQILNRSEPEALWDLVDLAETWTSPEGAEIPVGQALLAGQLWPGVLDLSDERAMARANRYLDPAKSGPSEPRRPAAEELLTNGRTRTPDESVADLMEAGLTLEQALHLLNFVS